MYEWGIPTDVGRRYERESFAPIQDDEVAAVVQVTDEAMDRKIEAIRRHETQIAFYEDLKRKFDFREVTRPEYFSLRRARVPQPREIEDDLLAGL